MRRRWSSSGVVRAQAGRRCGRASSADEVAGHHTRRQEPSRAGCRRSCCPPMSRSLAVAVAERWPRVARRRCRNGSRRRPTRRAASMLFRSPSRCCSFTPPPLLISHLPSGELHFSLLRRSLRGADYGLAALVRLMDPSYFTPRAARISNWLELSNGFRKTLGTPAPDAGGASGGRLEERVFDADPAPASIAAGSEEETALLARVDALLRPAARDARRVPADAARAGQYRRARRGRGAPAGRLLRCSTCRRADPAQAGAAARADARGQDRDQRRRRRRRPRDGRAITRQRPDALGAGGCAAARVRRAWALRDNPEAQRQGIVFFVDATDVSLRNSDPPTKRRSGWLGSCRCGRADRGLQRAICLWTVMAPLALAAMPALRQRQARQQRRARGAARCAAEFGAHCRAWRKARLRSRAVGVAALRYRPVTKQTAVAGLLRLTDL